MASDDSIVTLKHSKSGASAKIYKYGATITSYVNASGSETLFVSRDAKLDGSKAIRGGIPLVFPQFGQPDPSYPQHGFLRNNVWEFDQASVQDKVDVACCEFVLKLDQAVHGRGEYPASRHWGIGQTELDCTVRLKVQISAMTLETTLEITNTSAAKSFDFQCLFHTYYSVGNHGALDINQCNVEGLEGYSVVDKISKQDYTSTDKLVSIQDTIVDRVYNPPPGKTHVDVTIGTGSGSTVKLHASGKVDGATVPVSVVVWNPHQAKAAEMGDFGSDQYHDMICVEPGLLENVPPLPPNKIATLTQTITTGK